MNEPGELQHPDGVRVGVRELRANLATYVRRATAGTPVVITAGGEVVAVLAPPASSPAADLEALYASGQLVAPRRLGPPDDTPPVAVWSGVRLDRAFGELRG